MNKAIDSLVTGLTNEQFVGICVFLFIDITILAALVIFRKDIIQGLKGSNQMFELPEVLSFVYLYTLPSILTAACCLPTVVKIDTMGWVFMMLVTLAGLFGRWGLQWLLAFENKSTKVDEGSGVDDEKQKPIGLGEIKDLILKTIEEKK